MKAKSVDDFADLLTCDKAFNLASDVMTAVQVIKEDKETLTQVFSSAKEGVRYSFVDALGNGQSD